MHILFFFTLQSLLIAHQVLLHIWQFIDDSSVDSKEVVYLFADVLVDSLVDEAEEHVTLAYVVSVSEGYVGVTMCFSEEQFLYDVSVFSGTGACDHHELVAVELSLHDL